MKPWKFLCKLANEHKKVVNIGSKCPIYSKSLYQIFAYRQFLPQLAGWRKPIAIFVINEDNLSLLVDFNIDCTSRSYVATFTGKVRHTSYKSKMSTVPADKAFRKSPSFWIT